MPGYGAYATMKGGLEMLSRYLAKELGSRASGSIHWPPGAIDTDFNGGALRSHAALNQFVSNGHRAGAGRPVG